MASHRIAPAPALVSSFSARCAFGYTPENAPGSFAKTVNFRGHFFAKALLKGKTGRSLDDRIGSAEWGSRGRPFLRPMQERSALHHDAPSRSGVPAALPLPRAPPLFSDTEPPGGAPICTTLACRRQGTLLV